MFRLQLIGKVSSIATDVKNGKRWFRLNLTKSVFTGRKGAEFESRFITGWAREEKAEAMVAANLKKGDSVYIEGPIKPGKPFQLDGKEITPFEVDIRDWHFAGKSVEEDPAPKAETEEDSGFGF
jgi:hypothetical protein